MKDIFKKYKLWWLISTSIFTLIFANNVVYGFTGFEFIEASSREQRFSQSIVLAITGFISLLGQDGKRYLK